MSKANPKLDIQAGKSYEAYSEYSKTLRTWFVAYGIGGPILFVSQKEFGTLLAASPLKDTVIYLFLFGLTVQIGMALLNKWTNWQAYVLALNPPTSLSGYHRVVIWVAYQFWIDIVCDIISAIAFVIATFFLLRIALV